MCKFKDATEIGYIRVAGAIEDLVEDAGQMEAPEVPHENGLHPHTPTL
jgi:hypothetical protein